MHIDLPHAPLHTHFFINKSMISLISYSDLPSPVSAPHVFTGKGGGGLGGVSVRVLAFNP